MSCKSENSVQDQALLCPPFDPTNCEAVASLECPLHSSNIAVTGLVLTKNISDLDHFIP